MALRVGTYIIFRMDKFSARVLVSRGPSGVEFKPATVSDKRTMERFGREASGRYVVLSAVSTSGGKTYNQVRTVWALVEMLYECKNHGKPNKEQAAALYMDLVMEFAPRQPSLLHPGTDVPITLSQMSVGQAAVFIQTIINQIALYCELSDAAQVELLELFEQFQLYRGKMGKDPVDYDGHGNLLSTREWVERNPVSMASGRRENLEIAHIISKGARPEYRDCCWNFMRLTHYEHIEVQHKRGWDDFLALYPHLRPRWERAHEIAGKLDRLNDG